MAGLYYECAQTFKPQLVDCAVYDRAYSQHRSSADAVYDQNCPS